MKNFITLSLVVGAAAMAGGCIIETNNNHNPPPNQGAVAASWDLQDWNDSAKQPVQANCPAGADTAIVYTLVGGDTNPGNAIKDLFNCSDFAGTTAPITAGAYTVWVEITDHSGAVLYAQSNSKSVTLTGGAVTPADYQFQVNRGYVSAAWTLRGGTSNTTLNCAQAGAGGVEFDNMVGSNIPISDQFNCTDGAGTTYPLPIANYQFSAQAIDSSNPPLGIGPATVAGAAQVQWGNQLIDKGSLVLSIDGK